MKDAAQICTALPEFTILSTARKGWKLLHRKARKRSIHKTLWRSERTLSPGRSGADGVPEQRRATAVDRGPRPTALRAATLNQRNLGGDRVGSHVKRIFFLNY